MVTYGKRCSIRQEKSGWEVKVKGKDVLVCDCMGGLCGWSLASCVGSMDQLNCLDVSPPKKAPGER